MARHRVITSKNSKRTVDKRRRRICITVDAIYAFLLMTGILIVGINQFDPMVVGWGLIVLGGVSLPVAVFRIYIAKKGWSRATHYTNDDPKAKIAIAIEIIFLVGCSVLLPALGGLRLLGVL